MDRSLLRPLTPLALGLVLTAVVTGCRSPFDPVVETDDIRSTIRASIERELQDLPDEQPRTTAVQPSDTETALRERRDELDELSPALGERVRTFALGTDLAGSEQQEVSLTLERAINTAVANNLAIQIAQLQPRITLQDLITAQAAFDAVFFANVDFVSVEEQSVVRVIEGFPLGSRVQAQDAWRFETGVRADLITGASAYISTDLTRTDFRSPGLAVSPDPAYDAAVRLGVTQPLLRGFGTDVAETTIRLTRNLQQRDIEQLRIDLLQLVADAEVAYLDLVFAWQNLEIQQWLVDEGMQVRDVLERRRDFDARPAEYADAVATVEQRQAEVIRARRQLRAASDRLKLLLNDPELSVGSEAVIFPVDAAVATALTYNVREAIVTAVNNRPEIEQARLLIDDTVIQQRLAANALLPRLDLTAQVDFLGLDDSVGNAYEDIGEGFLNYLFGVAFEMPIGNRAAQAGVRQARLQRSASLLGYRQTVRQVVLDVKTALRDVVTNYELIQATRSFRVAQAENLRALMVREPLVGMTPEFLNLMFQRQATLASARQQELLALANFNQSVALLYRAMGTGLTMHGIEFDQVHAQDR